MLYHVAERLRYIAAVVASLWSPAAREWCRCQSSLAACALPSWCPSRGTDERVAVPTVWPAWPLESWRELPPSQLAVATPRVSTESVVSTVSTAAVGG